MSQKWIEEVSMKRMDRQSDKKNGNATEMGNNVIQYFGQVL